MTALMRRRMMMQMQEQEQGYTVPCYLPCNEVVEGYPSTSGQASASNAYTDMEYIGVQAGRSLTLTVNGTASANGYLRWAYYNAGKAFLSRHYTQIKNNTSSTAYTHTTPDNAAFILVAITNCPNSRQLLPLVSLEYAN